MTTTRRIANEAVSILGAGRMGRAIGTTLLDTGRRVTVWNRTREKADRLVHAGAHRAGTAAEALAAHPVVILTLTDYASAREVIEPAHDLLDGRVLVNLITGTPDEARALDAWATAHGAEYLDGAMMAVPDTVGTPEAFFIYSGSKDAFDANRDLLETAASSQFLGTDASTANFYDAALLGTMYGALGGFLHSAAILDTVGVKATQFAPQAVALIEGLTPFMTELAQEIDSAEYTNAASTVEINRKAIDNIVAISEAAAISADAHRPLQALLARSVAEGHAAESFSSLIELVKRT